MGRAYSEDFAWTVLVEYLSVCWSEALDVVCLRFHVSRHYVSDVVARYVETGSVATHQGTRRCVLEVCALTRLEDWQIVQQIVRAPRMSLRDSTVR